MTGIFKHLRDLLYAKIEAGDYNLNSEQDRELEKMINTGESKVYDVIREYTGEKIEDLTYRVKRLPTYIIGGVRRVKNFLVPYFIVAKERGRYYIGRRIIDIDPVDILKKGGCKAYSTLEAITHEIIHAYQEKLGHMKIYTREIVEGIASYLNSKVWGNYGNEPYQAETNIIRELVKRYGEGEIIKPSNPRKIVNEFYGMY